MSLIYLASPYSHNDPKIRQERYDKTLRVTAKLITRGYHIFSPIAYIHAIVEHLITADCTIPTDYFEFKNGEKFDKDIIRRCDEFWVFTLDGFKNSIGVIEEWDFAQRLYLPIMFVDENCNIMSNI
jgi:hypothetical protein